jgi:archaellum component FlaC
MADPQLTAEQIAKATAEYQKQRDILESLNDQFDDIENNLNTLAKEAVKFAKANKDNVRQISELKGIYNDLSKTARTLSSYTEDFSKGQLQTKNIAKTLNDLANTENRLQRQITQAVKDGNTALAWRLKKQLEELDRERKIAEELERENKAIDKKIGLTGKLLNSLSKIPVIGDALDFEEINKKMRLAAKNGEKVFAAGSEEIKKQLTDALKDPLVQFALGLALVKSGINDIKKAFSAFTEIDTTVTATSRTLGITNDQVYEMNRAAKEVGLTQDGTLFTTKQISQAIAEINSQLGLSVNLGAEETAEFAAMTVQMGLAATEAANIYKLGKLTNLSLKDTNKAISAQIVAVQKQTGIQINAKQVFQEIGKLSAGITAKFQQNPELIAKAVAQAKTLGTSLEKLDKIGESLLNFETSIENELKAELITGKQLNFERARAASLTGDQVALMQEVASQVGTLEDFNNMNVIAQKSLAEAFGMSRDELADMLQQQAVFNKLGDVSGKSAAEQLKIAREKGLAESDSLMINLKQQDAAEKLAATFDTIKLAIADLLSGPFSIFVDMMSFLSKNAWAAYAAVGAMAGISIFKLLAGVVSLAASLATAGVSAATVNSALTFGVGAVAVLAALGAIIGAMSSATSSAQSQAQQVQDGIAPSSKGPFTITDAFGATAITANGDSLAVSPNVSAGGDSGLMSAINELRNAVNALANKPSPAVALNVSGQKLGEIVGKQSETGTNQYQNAYRLA